MCLVPDFFIKLRRDVFYPSPVDIVLRAQKQEPLFDFDEWMSQAKNRELEEAERLKKEAEER